MAHSLVVGGFFNEGFLHALIMLALAFLWGFALYDLATRKLSGTKKVAWLLIIILIPFIGVIVYLVTRPEPAYSGSDERAGMTQQGEQDRRITEIQHTGI
ncbi:MAG TPA: PLD nuclease N-terminal domain-containing protein [Gaiellaceae bacterium]|nr:PLD nuclease N-terminal domain-containing protein [Gaiellaceae bacterium]